MIFGRQVSQAFKQSANYNGKFINQIPTSMNMGIKDTLVVLKDFIKGVPHAKPSKPIVMDQLDPAYVKENKLDSITWFGHSTFLLKLNGLTIFIDPMLGKSPSPVPLFGSKRYSGKLPIEAEQLPPIDLVLLSHDHFDHLDSGSIRKLKDKVGQYFVPLGVSRHLMKWGVDPSKIKEFDWWEEAEFEGLTLACTPARHFSGRGLFNRDSTLWCSWVIVEPQTRIYFSGDSGYAPHFAEIGRKYGPFDLTLMECGQYDERWSAIHMMPEETVQAHLDLKGNKLIPIHWGAFTLALHAWTDPIERVWKAARAQGVSISTPRIGETITISAAEYPTSTWWK